jgi:hypothetical protein
MSYAFLIARYSREHWAPVIGYEGLYEVSNLGRVQSLDHWVSNRWGGSQLRKGRILAQFPWRYFQVQLSRDGTAKKHSVHRLVLEAFAGPCPPGQEACHGPGGKLVNTWPAGLSWGTRSKNQGEDRERDGTLLRGGQVGTAKLNDDLVAEILSLRGTATHKTLADRYEVAASTISMIMARINWKHVA